MTDFLKKKTNQFLSFKIFNFIYIAKNSERKPLF